MPLKKHYFDLKKKLFLEAGFSFASFTLLNGIFLIGFALALGANNLQLGIIVAIPLFANLLQMFSAFILEITGGKKKTTITSTFIGKILWIIIILIAFGFIDKTITLLIIALILSNSFNAIGSLSLLSWTKDIVPIRRLARFFGKKNMYASAGGIVVYLTGSYLIDKFTGLKIYGYLFLFATILGLLALLFLKNIPDRKRRIKAIHPKKFLHRLGIPFKDPHFKPLLYFGLLWGFAINFAAPFFLVFMIKDLSLKFLVISFFLLLDTLSRIYGMSVWRNIAGKFGSKPLLRVAATVTSIVPLAYVFITVKNYFFLPLIFIVGAFSYSAIDLSITQVLFKSAPKKYDAYYLSTFTSLIGLASALGPIAGGFLAELVQNHNLPFLQPLKYVFIVSFILRTSCIPLIGKIQEKKSKDVSDIIETMKTLKFASFFVTVYSFSHYVSKIVLVPQKQLFILQRKTLERTKDLRKINKLFSNTSVVLNKIYNKITPNNKRKVTLLKKQLTEHLEKIDYSEPVHKVPEKVLSKIESLESSFDKGTKTEIKKQVTSIKKVVEEGKKKIDSAAEQEIK